MKAYTPDHLLEQAKSAMQGIVLQAGLLVQGEQVRISYGKL